ncbi:MAG: hypothetical protein ACOYVK_02750 [Bacillota bacterium]
MFFPDYEQTGVVYHIVSIIDLEDVLSQGIRYNDKITYKSKYHKFHRMIDSLKTKHIPEWVIREKSIFASFNYPKDHKFHSHTAILAIKIDPDRCWVANENCANQVYEPFILERIDYFCQCSRYLEKEGKELLLKYWDTSLSFRENLLRRLDKKKGYDAEVLIQHDIPPENIQLLSIISDHRMMDVHSWIERFCK